LVTENLKKGNFLGFLCNGEKVEVANQAAEMAVKHANRKSLSASVF